MASYTDTKGLKSTRLGFRRGVWFKTIALAAVVLFVVAGFAVASALGVGGSADNGTKGQSNSVNSTTQSSASANATVDNNSKSDPGKTGPLSLQAKSESGNDGMKTQVNVNGESIDVPQNGSVQKNISTPNGNININVSASNNNDGKSDNQNNGSSVQVFSSSFSSSINNGQINNQSTEVVQ